MTTPSLLSSLCRSNHGILRQKLGLMEALVSVHGAEKAKGVFQNTCPIVQASLGQHVRHSMDHLERAAFYKAEIHYDLRERGGPDEHDMDAACQRIHKVQERLDQLAGMQGDDSISHTAVDACFMLSGETGHEFKLPSTVARELGFAAHHAIHHMALVRIIAVQSGGLTTEDLPVDFGRAPSTVNYDHQTQQ